MQKKGFTLVEVLVVVVIVAILACIAVPNLFGTVAKAKGAEIQAASGTYIHLQDAYVGENNAVGNWNNIGYGAPSGGETSTFSYSQGDITTAKKLENMTTEQIGWAATNLVNLNDCQQKNYWTISITNVDGKQVSYKSSVSSDACVPIVSGWNTDVAMGSQAASSFDSGKNSIVATAASSSAKTATSSASVQKYSATQEQASVATSSASTNSTSNTTTAVASSTSKATTGGQTVIVNSGETQSTGDVGNSGSGSTGETGSGSGGSGSGTNTASVTSSSSTTSSASEEDDSIAEDACDAATEASIAEASTAFENSQNQRATAFQTAQTQRKNSIDEMGRQIADLETQLGAQECGKTISLQNCRYENEPPNNNDNKGFRWKAPDPNNMQVQVCDTVEVEDNNGNCLTAAKKQQLTQQREQLSRQYEYAVAEYERSRTISTSSRPTTSRSSTTK